MANISRQGMVNVTVIIALFMYYVNRATELSSRDIMVYIKHSHI